jgi:hypothetical protein
MNINVLVQQWRELQALAAASWVRGDTIEATRLYERAGSLEDTIFDECCKAGKRQIHLRRWANVVL